MCCFLQPDFKISGKFATYDYTWLCFVNTLILHIRITLFRSPWSHPRLRLPLPPDVLRSGTRRCCWTRSCSRWRGPWGTTTEAEGRRSRWRIYLKKENLFFASSYEEFWTITQCLGGILGKYQHSFCSFKGLHTNNKNLQYDKKQGTRTKKCDSRSHFERLLSPLK